MATMKVTVGLQTLVFSASMTVEAVEKEIRSRYVYTSFKAEG
jgi:hypothetical protein